MSGETKYQVSGWTIDTIKEHFDHALDALDVRLAKEVEHAKEMASAAHRSAQQAIDKAEISTAAKFATVNEFRAALTDQSDRMMPRVESEARHTATAEKMDAIQQQITTRFDAMSARIDELNRRMLLREGADTGTKETKQTSMATIAIIVAAVGVVSGVLGSVLATIMRPMGVH